jgi:uncharacterized protein YndB with AHSA1/START domain
MAPNELTLDLDRMIPAPRERVFHACTDAADLAKWWGPHGFTIPEVDFTPRVGAGYRLAMQPPDGELFHLAGEFRDVDPPNRLVFTFRWEPPDPDDLENVVALDFLARDNSTELVLHQEPFATKARLELHRQGWTDSMERLAALLSQAVTG